MMKFLLAALIALLPLGAEAANCSSNPFTLTNGQTADATQVMSNFNNLLNCANNNLAHNGANADITSLTGLTTPLGASEGGTGLATLPANSVLLGNGVSALQTVAPSTAGALLQTNGTIWQSIGPFANHSVLVGKGSGNLVAVPPATAGFGFVLTTNGVNADPSFQQAGVFAWARFDGTAGGPIAPAASYNIVNSITKNATGDYTLVFLTNPTDVGYAATCSVGISVGVCYLASIGASSFEIQTKNLAGVLTDFNVVSVSVFR